MFITEISDTGESLIYDSSGNGHISFVVDPPVAEILGIYVNPEFRSTSQSSLSQQLLNALVDYINNTRVDTIMGTIVPFEFDEDNNPEFLSQKDPRYNRVIEFCKRAGFEISLPDEDGFIKVRKNIFQET